MTAFVAVPETAMNEDDGLVLWQDYIGLAGKGFVLQFVAVAISVQEPAHQHLGLGVLAFNLTHVVAAGSLVVHICHEAKIVPYKQL